jgi:hypothetical protein
MQCGHHNEDESEFCGNSSCGAFLQYFGAEAPPEPEYVAEEVEPEIEEDLTGVGDYVMSATRNEIILISKKRGKRPDLEALGASRGLRRRRDWKIQFTTYEEFAWLYARLRDMGFAFRSGKGWMPAAYFEHFRQLGMLEGHYVELTWRAGDPGEPGELVKR